MPTRDWWATEWDRSAYDRQRYEAAKQQLIALLGGKCARCGTTENLQFDHVNRELKDFAITGRWNRSQAELEAELAKCQLLCQPHHLEKTRQEIGNEHGGGKTGIRKCKCELCRNRRSEHMIEYRRERKKQTT
jgi:5-methylcytosine-specific restriction endonuclease McrA